MARRRLEFKAVYYEYDLELFSLWSLGCRWTNNNSSLTIELLFKSIRHIYYTVHYVISKRYILKYCNMTA